MHFARRGAAGARFGTRAAGSQRLPGKELLMVLENTRYRYYGRDGQLRECTVRRPHITVRRTLRGFGDDPPLMRIQVVLLGRVRVG
jgi:hypothetical protein